VQPANRAGARIERDLKVSGFDRIGNAMLWQGVGSRFDRTERKYVRRRFGPQGRGQRGDAVQKILPLFLPTEHHRFVLRLR